MMLRISVWGALSILFTLSGVWTYPSGAPSSSCGIYLPNHHAYPDSPRTNPYTVVASSHNYNVTNSDGRIEVNITGSNIEFRGFVLAAYDEFGQPFGTFLKSDIAHQIHGCNGPAMTHSNAHRKYLVTLYWKPPAHDAPPAGIVNFRATVVNNYHRFWIEIPSTVQEEVNPVDHLQ